MVQTIETLQIFGGLLATMVVLFVPITVGIVLLQRWVGPDRLRRWLGGRSLAVALLKGTALGAVTPFCGCSTIPLLLGLLRVNVRFAAVAAFTLASPLLNPYILTVVALLFGPSVAVAYAGVAVASTLVLAALAEVAGLERAVRPHVRPEAEASAGGSLPPASLPTVSAPVASIPSTSLRSGATATSLPGAPGLGRGREDGRRSGGPTEDASCGGSPSRGQVPDGQEVPETADDAPSWAGLRAELRGALRGAGGLLRPMVGPVLVGLAIGALAYGAVPEGALGDLLGTSSWYALPLAAALGLPLYLRGEAAFPIGAGLLAAGVEEGPMFAMVIAGMGASVPEVTILSGIFQRRLLLAFLGAVFTMAIVGGALIPRLA